MVKDIYVKRFTLLRPCMATAGRRLKVHGPGLIKPENRRQKTADRIISITNARNIFTARFARDTEDTEIKYF